MDVRDLPSEVIDRDTFEQILEMDDDEEERDFSKGIVVDFLSQAETTLDELDTALGVKNLTKLSELGHYLKGSSATLGLSKVKVDCEKIQNFGNKLDATGENAQPDEEVCLKGIKDALADLKKNYAEASGVLKKFFDLE
ncbi:signal transduction histidine kinase [Microdochium trichocladiopsis]|uniref:Signal transduction histidine kinase n=1 Tax=Microdochium trichocladiopsis TaxID=1682393 RepID=A0A9P8Y7Z6_9PEZI|nr:signal transduction histidine kinase [Microdochium trichocladiopsis]KAH7031373.1 signal transduction histidine kinase [Microdochium trichocladiopsis]